MNSAPPRTSDHAVIQCGFAHPKPSSVFFVLGLSVLLLLKAFVPRLNAADDPVSFTRDVAPLLSRKCLTCHNAEKNKGKFRLDTFERLLKPGSSKDPSIVPTKPEESRLLTILREKDPEDRMPQKDDPLPPAQIALIERWIREGARFDGSDVTAVLAGRSLRGPSPEAYARAVPITGLCFSPDGQTLVSSGYHEIILWNAEKGTMIRRIQNLPTATQNIDWSPDTKWIAAASGAPGQGGEVILIDALGQSPERVLASLPDLALDVRFSPDGTRLAASGSDNAIRIFDIPGGKELLVIQQHADWVVGLAWSPDGTHLASASRDRTARIFNAQNGELETTFVDHNAAVLAVAFAADGKTVISSARDKKIHRWSEKDGKKSGEFGGAEEETLHLIVSGPQLFSAGATGAVRLFNIETKAVVRTFSGHQDWVYGLTVNAATKRLASGSFDGEIRVWNMEDGRELERFIAAPGMKDRVVDRQ